MSTDLIRTYANTLQGIYDERTGGFHSFVGVLANFGKELLAQDHADHLTSLRAEVEAMRDKEDGPHEQCCTQHALDLVLDLIDKRAREGQ